MLGLTSIYLLGRQKSFFFSACFYKLFIYHTTEWIEKASTVNLISTIKHDFMAVVPNLEYSLGCLNTNYGHGKSQYSKLKINH